MSAKARVQRQELEVNHPRSLLAPTGPLDVRSTSLAALALLSSIYFLRVAQAVFIPIAIAIVTACAMAPIVNWLRRSARVPRPLGAAATILLLCALLGAGVSSLQPQVLQLLDVVPRATAKFSQTLRDTARDRDGAVHKLTRAAAEIERAAAVANTPGATPQRSLSSMRSDPAPPPFKVGDYIMMGTANAVAGFGQLIVVLSLVYFLLISSDSFRRALVRASGDSLAKKKVALRIIKEIDVQIRRYLQVQVATSLLLGAVIWIAFAGIGLDNALFWACVGALLHMIPYIGPAVFMLIVSMVSYAQFQTWGPVSAVIISILLSTGIIGMLLVPWLTQKVIRLNAVTVIVTLLFWSWLWGTWGLLLGIPIMLALNAICERIEGLQVISHFLSGAPTGGRFSHHGRRAASDHDRPCPAGIR